MAGEGRPLLTLSTMAELEATEIPASQMSGMEVLGEAITQAEFLTDHVMLQDLAGPKSIQDMADMQAQLRGIGEMASLQTIQQEHAYPATTHGAKARPLIKEAEHFIRSTYPDVVTITMEDTNSAPFLTVLSKYPDSRFLVDQSSLRLNIRVGSSTAGLACSLLTYNREVVREAEVEQAALARDMGELVEDMLGERYICCSGLTLPSTSLLEHLTKSDIPDIMIEKYNGVVVHRARTCPYIIDQETRAGPAAPSTHHCNHCTTLSSALASRHLAKLAVPEEEVVEERGEGRKRGRPKGSRKRARMEEDEEDGDTEEANHEEILRELAEEVKLQQESVLEDAEQSDPEKSLGEKRKSFEASDDFALEDDPEDINFTSPVTPKRGRRKKVISKKAQEMESSKLRPGRKAKVSLPVTCPEEGCRQLLETVDQFREHQSSVHPASLVCLEEGCLKRFNSSEELEAHTRRHKGERPFSCHECKKEFTTRQDLRLHYRKHTGERPYPCDQCSKEFSRKAALRIHKISVHSELKSYLCADCGAAFKANSALIDHKKRVHMQIKSHHCEVCGKEFFSKKDYGEHCRTHTGEKPYQCPLCGKCFGRGYHLKRHTDGVHRNPPGPRGVLVTPQSPGSLATSLTIDPVPTQARRSAIKKIKVLTSKPVAKSSVLATSLAFTTAETITSFDLRTLTPAEEDKEVEKEEDKPLSEAKDFSARAPLDLAQRSSVVSLLSGQRKGRSEAPADLEVEGGERPAIVVTSTHTFPAFTGQPTYLVGPHFYRGQDGHQYVEEQEVDKMYKL